MRRAGLLILPFLLIFPGCSHQYPKSDALLKGGQPDVPSEFRKGTASLDQAKAWSASLLSGLWDQPHLDVVESDLDQDGVKDVLISETHLGGTGGNTYLAFARTPKGYRYLGNLAYSVLRVLPKEDSRPPRIVTAWRVGAGESGVTLYLLDAAGFHEIGVGTLRTGDQGTGESRRLAAELFGTNAVSSQTLQQVFGKADQGITNR